MNGWRSYIFIYVVIFKVFEVILRIGIIEREFNLFVLVFSVDLIMVFLNKI